MKFLHVLSVAFVLVFGACTKESNFKTLPTGPVQHHLIVVAKAKSGVRARGFSGATPPATEIFCEVGASRGSITSNADGSFVIDLPDADQNLALGELTFLVDKKYLQQGYKIRDLPTSLVQLTKEAFETDKEVDAINFYDNSVAIVSSQANLLRTFLVDSFFRLSESASTAVLLHNADNTPLYPSTVAAVGEHLAVGLNLAHEVALVAQNGNAVAARSKAEDAQGRPFKFALPTPLTLKNPLDADESGTAKIVITDSIARNPETIVAIDASHFLVGFSNYYQFEDESRGHKSAVGPAVIALMAIENGTIKTKATTVLDLKNPRYFVVKDTETIWVVLSGEWHNLGKANLASSDAGLVRLKIAANHESFSVDHRIPLKDFAPALPALVNNKLIIPHTDRNEIAVIDESAVALTDKDRVTPNFHREFGFTFAKHWHDDIVFLGDKKGTLVAYSLKDGYFPFPFVEPVFIDKNVDERIGLRPQTMYFRHDVNKFDLKKSSPQGFSAWIVSESHQKIYPMDFLEVFGP